MKKLFTLFLFIFCLVPVITGCSGPQGGDEDDNNQVLEVKNGTEVAKILLANERLDEKVLEQSGTLFTDGKKAMARIIDQTKQYLKRNAGRPNETYTEVDGDTIKWYNDVDYSNFMSFFESYAVNIEDSAQRSADLIDYAKKYIRVVNKWVDQGFQEYFLVVNENSEIIINRDKDQFINLCKRYTDENGNSVYEMLQGKTTETLIRMKYIPNLLYEFVIQFGNDESSKMYLNADKSKGYWTIFCGNGIQGYTDSDGKRIENFDPILVALKDESNYKLNYHIDTNGKGEINMIDIISTDSKTDLISLGVNHMDFFNTGIKGLDHIEITAPKDKIGDFDPNSREELYVYEQNNINDKGKNYKIYSTSGHKSATAVLENGMTLTEEDVLLDGKVTVGRIDVSYVAGCDSYGRIPLRTTATNYDEQFEILEEFLKETGITFRRDFDDVINGLKYALKDVKSFGDYFTWNGYHLNDMDSVKKAIQLENEKTEQLKSLYNQVKDIEVIDIADQEKYNANIHFSNIIITNPGTITNNGFTVSIKDFSVKVEDTLLFVDQEMYKVVFALLNKEGNLISFLNEADLTTQYIKGNELVLTQTKDITIEMLEAGEYTLVAYVALASEGIRVTNYQKVSAEITELARNEQGFKNTIKSNANKELVIISEIDYNLYCEFEGEFTYEMLKEFMGQTAYDHGMIDELKIEMLDGENWILVEATSAKIFAQGQYRMKYIVNSENQKEAYVFVTIK